MGAIPPFAEIVSQARILDNPAGADEHCMYTNE